MLAWVEPFIWTALRWMGNAMQFVGLIGLIIGAIIAVNQITNRILEKEM